MSEILTSIIKEITSDVTIDSIPAITPQQKVTAEFVNAVNQGFKLGINGNFKLIKAHNGLHIDTLSGKEFSGKSRFVGVFENVNLGETIPVFEVNFGLVKFVDFNNENFWKDFLQDTILFVKVNNSNNGSILHLNCKFLTQSQTTDGDGDTSITYTEYQKTIQLRLIKSDEEPYTVNNLIDKITPIKLSFDEIDSGIIYFNAQTTDDITVADLTNLWEEVNTLNTKMTMVENGLDNKIERKITAGLHAYTHNGAVDTETEISQSVKPNTIPLRGSNGELVVELEPSSDSSAASKKYTSDMAYGAINNIQVWISTLQGEPNGLATLDSGGKVPSSQLPSYVDDVLVFDSFTDFPDNPAPGKIYIARDTNKQYRWNMDSASFIELYKGVELGTTDQTAYRGDRGKALYDFANTAIADGNLKTQIDSKMNKSDRYLGWTELTAVDNEAEFDFNVSDKYYIDTASEITLDIINALDGSCGLVKVSGGGTIVFPIGSIYNADSGYLNAESGQSYLYSFVSLGGVYMVNRTVVNG